MYTSAHVHTCSGLTPPVGKQIRKQGSLFHVLHLPGTSDGNETPAPHCIHTQAMQLSVANTIPLKAVPIGISPDFSISDTLLQRDFPMTDFFF